MNEYGVNVYEDKDRQIPQHLNMSRIYKRYPQFDIVLITMIFFLPNSIDYRRFSV